MRRRRPEGSDVTDLFLRYRECARHVWNTAFRDLRDGWHEFMDVDHVLFSGIVLVQASEAHDWRAERSTHGCYPSLRVQPRPALSGIRVMWARDGRRTETWLWAEVQLRPTAIELAFIEFFDWNQDVQDFQYARTRVLSCAERPDLVGADMLIGVQDVAFTFSKRDAGDRSENTVGGV